MHLYVCVCVCVYIYIYIYIYGSTFIASWLESWAAGIAGVAGVAGMGADGDALAGGKEGDALSHSSIRRAVSAFACDICIFVHISSYVHTHTHTHTHTHARPTETY